MKRIFAKKNLNSSENKFDVPQKLRVRIVKIAQHLVEKVIVESYPFALRFGESPAYEFYQRIHGVLCYEFGQFTLVDRSNSAEEDVLNFLLKTENPEQLLKTIEYLFQFAYEQIFAYEKTPAGEQFGFSPSKQAINSFEAAVTELNQNFNENNIDYQYESGRMIRVDSQFTHQEIIKPVLTVLVDPIYKGANAEFLSAYDHYQAGRYKESMNECLKAFESCMKSICQKRKWNYNQTDAAKKLIDILFNQGLFPKYMVSQFGGVRSILESGIPPMCNKQSAHGQGPKVVPVPKHMARYALNLTGANIILLADLESNMP